METANSTGWGPLKKRLEETKAHVVLAQETWLTTGKIAAGSAWARARGWQMLASAATRGKSGGASGGVAIFARMFIGLRLPPNGNYVLEPGRAVTAVIDLKGWRPTAVVSAYLHDGGGLNQDNKGIMAKIAIAMDRWGPEGQYIIGGDFNVPPSAIEYAGILEKMKAVIVQPETKRGTCRTKTSARTLDYFIVSTRLSNGVEETLTVEGSNVRTHTPVRMKFHPRLTALKTLEFRALDKLEKRWAIGPWRPGPSWEPAREAMRKALNCVRANGPNEETQQELNEAYLQWATAAESELVERTGSHISVKGNRGKEPRMRWASIIPEKKPTQKQPLAATTHWMKDVVGEISRMVTNWRKIDRARENLRDEDEEVNERKEEDFMEAITELARSTIDDFNADIDDPECLRNHSALIDLTSMVLRWSLDRFDRTGLYSAEEEEQIKQEIADLEAKLTRQAEAVDVHDKKQEGDGWKEWIGSDWNKGARNAHKYSRLPAEWVPTEVSRHEDGEITSAPADVLEDLRSKYAERWQPFASPAKPKWKALDENDKLPRLTKEEVREAAKAFPWSTAETHDGFHVRHLGMLSDDGTEVLAGLYEVAELLGAMPEQISLITMPLIDKSSGGYRGIGILPAFYRVWTKARRPLAQAWEAGNLRSYWSATAANSPVDTVWRQAARQEAAVAEGEEAAVLLYDLEAFYETMDRQLILERARATGFPMAVIRMALSTYGGPRMLSLRGALARELFPVRGIVPGCSLATTIVKVYCIKDFDRMMTEIPRRVHFDAHIDDLVLTAEDTPKALLENLTAAEAVLREVITNGLKGTIAEKKIGVVATSMDLARKICSKIPRASQNPQPVMTNLGIDVTAAGRRGFARCKSKWRKRVQTARKRATRLRTIGRALGGKKAIRIFSSGVEPAATYGAAVHGINDLDVRALRQLAANCFPPHARTRSLTLNLLVNGLPTAKAETATVNQLARMVWKSVTRAKDAAMRGASVEHLRAWHEAACDNQRQNDLEDLIRTAALAGKKIEGKLVREAWKGVKGPMTATSLTLARWGWKLESALSIIDDRGNQILLADNSPSTVGALAKEGLRRAMERYMGAKWADNDNLYEGGRRVCADLVEAWLKKKLPQGLTALQRGCFRACAMGAEMTMSKAAELGYNVADKCPLCGEAGDTLHHRGYGCERTRAAVMAEVLVWFFREASRANPSDKFWTTGIFPHPDDICPPPAKGFHLLYGQAEGVGEDWNGIGGATGKLVIDGSCDPSPIRGLSRAGCCIVEADGAGRMMKEVLAPIPRHMPQTAQVAEHVAYALSVRLAEADVTIFTDCKGVKEAAQMEFERVTNPRRMNVGISRDTYRDPEQRRRVQEVKWVKAHRGVKEANDEQEKWEIMANDLADDGAKRAVKLQPQWTGTEGNAAEFYAKRFPHVAKAMAIATSMFPTAPGNMERIRPPRNEEDAMRSGRHFWEQGETNWRCKFCWSWATVRPTATARRTQRCSGPPKVADAERMAELGHHLCLAEGDPPIWFCSTCGGTMSRRTRILRKGCTKPTANGKAALNRLANGWHPWQKRELRTGKFLPRGRIEVKESFCRTAARWSKRKYAGAYSRKNRSETREAVKEFLRPVNDHIQVSQHAPFTIDQDTPPEIVEDARSEEEDVFNHGGKLSYNGDDSTDVHADTDDKEPAPPTLCSDEDDIIRVWISSGLGRRNRATLNVDDSVAAVQAWNAKGEQIWIGHLADVTAKNMEREPGQGQALRIMGTQISFDSNEDAETVLRQVAQTYIRCDTCQGTTRAGEAEMHRPCCHYACGGCTRNKEAEDTASGRKCPRCSKDDREGELEAAKRGLTEKQGAKQSEAEQNSPTQHGARKATARMEADEKNEGTRSRKDPSLNWNIANAIENSEGSRKRGRTIAEDETAEGETRRRYTSKQARPIDTPRGCEPGGRDTAEEKAAFEGHKSGSSDMGLALVKIEPSSTASCRSARDWCTDGASSSSARGVKRDRADSRDSPKPTRIRAGDQNSQPKAPEREGYAPGAAGSGANPARAPSMEMDSDTLTKSESDKGPPRRRIRGKRCLH